MDGWIILRTAGKSTLRLAASLTEDGFEVWTPVVTQRIRKPRANLRRMATLPMTPSFVFARACHLVDLLGIAAMPERPRRGPGGSRPAHVGFSVFHHNDRIPVIRDRDLEALREEEHAAVPRKRQAPFSQGQAVRVTKGSFEGMTGIIDRSDGKEAQVWLSLFGRHHRAKIPTSLLRPDEVISRSQPVTGIAA